MRMCGWEERCLFQGIKGECTYGEASVRCKHERSDSMGLSVGDDVTISGKIIEIKDSMLHVRTASGCEYWVKVEDVKT